MLRKSGSVQTAEQPEHEVLVFGERTTTSRARRYMGFASFRRRRYDLVGVLTVFALCHLHTLWNSSRNKVVF